MLPQMTEIKNIFGYCKGVLFLLIERKMFQNIIQKAGR
jgi:hypothetical protein